MSTLRLACGLVLVFFTAIIERGSLSLAQNADDTVVLSNTSGPQVGILVNGQSSAGTLMYKSFSSSATTIDVGQLTALPSNNEILAFNSGRPVAESAFVWTNGVDAPAVAFANEIAIPVTFWIVWGDPNTQQDTIARLMAKTISIWTSQGMGVVFASASDPNPTRIVDATTNPKASSYYSFDCGQQSNLQSDIGKDEKRINVYLVNAVAPNGIGWGDSCGFGTGFAAIADKPPVALLAHELGHNFMLTHVDYLDDGLDQFFDETNVMYSASNTRKYFTQGQLFHAHFWSASALNAIYGARPDQPTRDCQPDESSLTCPPIQKRIWRQGKFAPN